MKVIKLSVIHYRKITMNSLPNAKYFTLNYNPVTKHLRPTQTYIFLRRDESAAPSFFRKRENKRATAVKGEKKVKEKNGRNGESGGEKKKKEEKNELATLSIRVGNVLERDENPTPPQAKNNA